MHISSLPGPYFNGDLGKAAFEFIDFLAAAGQSWWQMLPVNPLGPGNSPYASISAFAGEALFIDLKDLVRRGWLKAAEITPPTAGHRLRVDYERARKFRNQLLRRAFSRAVAKKGLFDSSAFLKFQKQEQYWLDDYTLFGAISAQMQSTDWQMWPRALRFREAKALQAATTQLETERRFLSFTQFLFHEQWQAVQTYARQRGIGLIGDLPIFVGFKSADVWANPRYFLLDKALTPKYVAGVPPDAFNRNGQLWGNALYNWDVLEEEQFSWWLGRISKTLDQFTAVRLDHFIGFYRYWRIPSHVKTARTGSWQPARGDALFTVLQQQFTDMPFIAEDLGAVIPPVRALRDKFGLPGMKVLQFAFDGSNEAREHQPHHFQAKSVVYTGTHDNHTAIGWIDTLKQRARHDKKAHAELAIVAAYFGVPNHQIAPAMVRAAMQSPAALCITPVQDLLGLADTHRMNIPGTATGNWRWRVDKRHLTRGLASELQSLTVATGRG